MANYLILNQPQVFNGLGALTYVVPAGTATQLYSVQVQATFPYDPAINSKVSNAQGIGFATLGFMGAGSGSGLGAGTGGGGEGFVKGDQGPGEGGVGQGFGVGNNYQQPPSAPSNVTAQSPNLSELSIVVAKNAVTQYTSTVPRGQQSAVQFSTRLSLAAGDTVTITGSSSDPLDNQKDGITLIASIQQGL